MLVLAGLFIKKDFQMANLTMSPNFVPPSVSRYPTPHCHKVGNKVAYCQKASILFVSEANLHLAPVCMYVCIP